MGSHLDAQAGAMTKSTDGQGEEEETYSFTFYQETRTQTTLKD